MDESTKAKLGDGGADVLEAIASAIPLVGGPIAVVVNRTVGSARQRRLERIVERLVGDLQAAIDKGRIVNPAEVLSSDEALAAIERVVRVSAESSSEEKITLLRAAFVNGTAAGWRGPEKANLELVEQLWPQQVQILRRLDGGSTTHMRGQIEQRFFGRDPETHSEYYLFSNWWNELVRMGLIDEQRVSTAPSRGLPTSYVEARLSLRGADFLAFLGFEGEPDEPHTDEVLYPDPED